MSQTEHIVAQHFLNELVQCQMFTECAQHTTMFKYDLLIKS